METSKNRKPIRLHLSLLLSYKQHLLRTALRQDQYLRPFSKNDLLLSQMETDSSFSPELILFF